MAANGPKAMRRAGRYADGLITDPKTWKEHKAEFESGARTAGKDPAQLPVPVEVFVVVGDDNDAKASAELWRFIPKAFKTYYNVRDPQAIQDRATAELPLPKVYGDWPGLKTEQLYEGRDLALTTDFRDVFSEIASKHLGATNLNTVFPGYTGTAAKFRGVLG